MKVIDVHAHYVSLEMVAATAATGTSRPASFETAEDGEGLFLRLGGKGGVGPMPRAIHDIDIRLADMDRQGVDIQVVAIAPVLYYYDQPQPIAGDLARAANTGLLDLARSHPDRFLVAGTLPMQHPEAALDELRWFAEQPGAKALQIGSHVHGENLDSPEFDEVWAAIADSGLVVVIHPAHVAGADRMPRHHIVNLVGNPNDSTIAIASLILGGVLERHDLKMVFVHGGGFAPYQIGRWDHAWRTRPEVRAHSTVMPSATLSRCFFDSLTHDDDSLRFLGQRAAWDHVMVGTDYPFDMSESDPVAAVRRLELDPSDESRVLSSNAASLLGIEG